MYGALAGVRAPAGVIEHIRIGHPGKPFHPHIRVDKVLVFNSIMELNLVRFRR